MNEQNTFAQLIAEVARYLAAVDAFRAEQCEPTWLPEPSPVAASGRGHSRGASSSVGSDARVH